MSGEGTLDNDEFRCVPCDSLLAPATAEGDTGDENEAEEVVELRRAPTPVRPSDAEVEEHRKTHLPYRSWCRECVMGRCLGEQRGHTAGREHSVPRVGIDYFFITTKGIHKRNELQIDESEAGETQLQAERVKGSIVKCIIVRCHETKNVFAHVIPCKGLDEDKYVVKTVCDDIAWLGHVRLIIKSDGEKSILKLVRNALEVLKVSVEDLETISSESSQPYDSQSNGGTEVGIRNVRGLFRSLKLCLERRLGQQIPPSHALTSWLMEHTALLLNTSVRGTDGKTPWLKARGRDFGLRLHAFGEAVYYKQPPKGPQHDVQGNMGPRMWPGIFLGYNKYSNSYRILTDEGNMTKARALQAKPVDERWNVERLKAITCTPWSLYRAPEHERVELGPPVDAHEVPQQAQPSDPRRLKITRTVLQKYGATESCPQCVHIRAFGEHKPGLPHTEACRKRIMEAMSQTDEGQARLDKYEEKVDEALLRWQRGEQRERSPPEAAMPSATSTSREEVRGGMGLPADDGCRAETSEAVQSDMEVEDGGAQTPRGNGDEDDEMIGCLTVEEEYFTMLAMLGVPGRAHRREHRKAYNRIVSEIYSPPRVTRMVSSLPRMGLAPGFAFDITCADPDDGEPWDFDRPDKREKARAMIRHQKPLFLVGSPMCTAWCSWQALNKVRRDPNVVQRERVRAQLHLDFVMSLYQEQIEGGRFFLHEHPSGATSWEEATVKEVLELPGVALVKADQCQYELEVTHGKHAGQPIKKPTGFMSNAALLLDRLRRRCSGNEGQCSRRRGGTHVLCTGRIAKEAAKYSDNLCRAIIKGMYDEMRSRGIVRDGEVGLHAVTDEAELEIEVKKQDPRYSGRFRDDMTGQVLRDDLVMEARALELKYFKEKGVWVKRPKHEAKRVTGKSAISVRWVDVNKGDDASPRYRSRLVARQLKAHDKSNASFFAPTPPLEALRTVLSLAATKIGRWTPDYRPTSNTRMQISMMDISRAYFNAKTDDQHPTYVALPPEDEDGDEQCGLLKRHMYGTRPAADGWQEEYSSYLVQALRFVQGNASPCLFRHPERQLVVSVHGDDFTSAGAKNDIDWFEEMMQKHYELTLQPRLGPGPEDAREAIVLNRVIRWTRDGIEFEADPRQTEKLINECGMQGVNSVATPGVRASFADVENDKPLSEKFHTAFRAAAARANYLAADRLDVQFAAKEICRWMAKPSEASWGALKRLCRYLVGLPRMVHRYEWQEAAIVDTYTDTDWAGCPRTRKSTSGGCLLLGKHTIKTWSSTQSSISLSSGEAEFNGVVRGAGVALGYRSLMQDLGIDVPIRLWTDSSAAIGICSRQGLGKLRHLDTHTLWIQQAVRSKQVDLRKIDGEVNPADMFTKHSLTRDRLMALTSLFASEYRGGRAESAAQTRTSEAGRVKIAQADEINATGSGPIMPHRIYSNARLDEMYPALSVPDAVDADDPLQYEVDNLLNKGIEVAKQIVELAEQEGRRRYFKAMDT